MHSRRELLPSKWATVDNDQATRVADETEKQDQPTSRIVAKAAHTHTRTRVLALFRAAPRRPRSSCEPVELPHLRQAHVHPVHSLLVRPEKRRVQRIHRGSVGGARRGSCATAVAVSQVHIELSGTRPTHQPRTHQPARGRLRSLHRHCAGEHGLMFHLHSPEFRIRSLQRSQHDTFLIRCILAFRESSRRCLGP